MCVCVYIFFILFSVNRHLGCFYVLAIVNIAEMNIGVHVSFELWFSLDLCPRSGIAELHGNSILVF